MIICPLHPEECSRLIIPKPRHAFLMCTSEEKRTRRCKQVLGSIHKVLTGLDYKIIDGSGIVAYGDYFCSICTYLQACPFGIVVAGEDMNMSTLANIFVEAGIMQGFGKPVVMFVETKENLPSDFIRHFEVFYNSRGYSSKFKGLLNQIGNLEDFYSRLLADPAYKAGDYEKAVKYYEEAYLIGAKQETLQKLEDLISNLKSKRIPKGYKTRLLDGVSLFHEEAKRNVANVPLST